MPTEITADLVRHIARLSRIELTDEETAAFTRQLADVLESFEKLQQLDTENIEPMVHAVELTNVLAEDTPGKSLTSEEALANAPQREGGFFLVPKVIGEGS